MFSTLILLHWYMFSFVCKRKRKTFISVSVSVPVAFVYSFFYFSLIWYFFECLNICWKGVLLQMLLFILLGPAYCLTTLGFVRKKDGRFVCLFISFAHSKQHFCVFCVWICDSVLVQYVFFIIKGAFQRISRQKLVCLCVSVFFWKIVCLDLVFVFSVGSLSIDRLSPQNWVKKLRGAVFA